MTAVPDLVHDEPVVATPDEARARAEQIRANLERVAEWCATVILAYAKRDWEALGYGSWDAYIAGEYGDTPMRLPAAVRREVVAWMRASNMSVRAIASATGDSRGTVHNDAVAGVQKWTPDAHVAAEAEVVDEEPTEDEDSQIPAWAESEEAFIASKVTGTDGKQYAARRTPPGAARSRASSPQRRRPITEAYGDDVTSLRKAAERLMRLADDDRFRNNKTTVTNLFSGDLLRSMTTLTAIVERLDMQAVPEGGRRRWWVDALDEITGRLTRLRTDLLDLQGDGT